MKVAIVHDWLNGMRGGEKCVEVFCELFPEATLFTLMYNKGSVSPTIEKMEIKTSFLQKIPGISRNYQNYLPFFPAAIQSFDLTGYDLVLSSSHCVAKGVKTGKDTLHICYCYTPMRYAWKFFEEYFGKENSVKKWVISKIIEQLKKWDLESNAGVDYFVAISNAIQKRIEDFYGRSADIIYPPVDVDSHRADKGKEDFYLIVSALVPYKRIDLAIDAFNANGKKLIIIGVGNELERLKRQAKGNIRFLGWREEEEIVEHYSKCKALIFPGEEDFGIVPVEAQAHGKPVIAFSKGGILETVIPYHKELTDSENRTATGIFFTDQTKESLNKAISLFEEKENIFDKTNIRNNAMKFTRSRFKKEINEYVKDKIKEKIWKK